MDKLLQYLKLAFSFLYRHRASIYLIIFFCFMYRFSYKDFEDFIHFVLPYIPSEFKNQILAWIVTGLTSIPFIDLARKIINKIKEWFNSDKQ